MCDFRKLFFCVLILSFFVITQQVIANDQTDNFYFGKQPLINTQNQEDKELTGPAGSLLISSPSFSKKGKISVGSGFAFVKQKSIKIYQTPISISYTPIDAFTLSVGLPITKITGVSQKIKTGFGDLSYSANYSFEFLEFKSAIDMSYTVASGADRITGKRNSEDIAFTIPLEVTINDYTINIENGVSYTDFRLPIKKTTYKTGIALSRPLSNKIGGSIELSYSDNKQKSTLIMASGVKFNFIKRSSLSVLTGFGLHKNAIDFLGNLGVSYTF